MGSPFHISVLGFIALILLQQFNFSYSLTCTSQKFTGKREYLQCNDLPHLSSYIHWNYIGSQSALDIAFVAPPVTPTGWVAWAINPYSQGMVGSQTLAAYMGEEGKMILKTYNITSYELHPSKIDLEILDMEAEYVDGFIRIYATFILPRNLGTTVNQVWQVGEYSMGGVLAKHKFDSANMNSMGKLDLVKGEISSHVAAGGKLKHKYMHGILNTLSWGFLFPVGVIMARYLRTFDSLDPAWFNLHVSCQVIGYILGVAGWGTGMKLGYESKGIEFSLHRKYGIALFSLCTMQVLFALFLRPKKDHKYRTLWNFYHHIQGYLIVILGIVNVFKGLSILNPASKWINSYTLILYILLGIAIFAEVVTWMVYCKKRSPRPTNRYPSA
ncbi:hypothetical protein MKX01_042394 [Papaver californicum]|nr:hypothetical protein MKX01_042394 [Papaver californicum]